MKIDLRNYINKLQKEDIINYLNKESITANNEEIDIIYNSIKNDFDYIINNDFNTYLEKYKSQLNEELYNKIIEKHNEYKKFIE